MNDTQKIKHPPCRDYRQQPAMSNYDNPVFGLLGERCPALALERNIRQRPQTPAKAQVNATN